MTRVLLDENLPRRLGPLIAEDAETVQHCGWAGLRNGQLLKQAASRFDVLLTMDKGIEFQQSLAGLPLMVIGLVATSNRLDDLRPPVAAIKSAIASPQPGLFLRIGHG